MKLATIDRYHLQEKITDKHDSAVNSPAIWWLRLFQWAFVLSAVPAPFLVGWMPVIISVVAAILLQLVIIERVLVKMLKGWNE